MIFCLKRWEILSLNLNLKRMKKDKKKMKDIQSKIISGLLWRPGKGVRVRVSVRIG